jgi:hypothetical protein
MVAAARQVSSNTSVSVTVAAAVHEADPLARNVQRPALVKLARQARA